MQQKFFVTLEEEMDAMTKVKIRFFGIAGLGTVIMVTFGAEVPYAIVSGLLASSSFMYMHARQSRIAREKREVSENETA